MMSHRLTVQIVCCTLLALTCVVQKLVWFRIWKYTETKKEKQVEGKRTLYFCGWNPSGWEGHVFPEYGHKQELNWSVSTPTSGDLLIHSVHGPCKNGTERNFPGKILYATGEPDSIDLASETTYQLVISENLSKPHQMQLFPISRLLYMVYYDNGVRETILDPKLKAVSTKEHFLIYVANNCHPHRDKAFLQLSKIKPVHQGGKCPTKKYANVTKVDTLGKRDGFLYNFKAFKHYRFCLVLENTKMNGYVSEKIQMAFLGGCIPIYWGTLDVFKIFNAKSFIYYHVAQPELALERVRYLEANETAYKEVMAEPILANGMVTIEEYYSMNDTIGGGKLKQKIRDLLELK